MTSAVGLGELDRAVDVDVEVGYQEFVLDRYEKRHKQHPPRCFGDRFRILGLCGKMEKALAGSWSGHPGDATPCKVTPPCRMTGVTLHGVVSPEDWRLEFRAGEGRMRVRARELREETRSVFSSVIYLTESVHEVVLQESIPA